MMKKFNKNEIEDIVKNVEKSSQYDKCLSKPIRYFFSSGVLFVLLLAMNTLLKTTIGSLIISLSTFGIGSFLFFLEGIAVYKNPTSSFKRKYGKYFLEDETDFLFKNFEIPLYKTWFRNRIKELEDEVDKEGFSGQMKNEALFHRVKFFLENEVPEELKKENKRKMRLQEEKRMKNQEIEAKFKKYIDHYSNWLDTEKQ
jgi:hypothetical protein